VEPGYLRRAFVYLCAFVGASWFGDVAYNAAQNNAWPDEFTVIIFISLVVALVLAAKQSSRSTVDGQ